MHKQIYPCFWFDEKASEAAEFTVLSVITQNEAYK